MSTSIQIAPALLMPPQHYCKPTSPIISRKRSRATNERKTTIVEQTTKRYRFYSPYSMPENPSPMIHSCAENTSALKILPKIIKSTARISALQRCKHGPVLASSPLLVGSSSSSYLNSLESNPSHGWIHQASLTGYRLMETIGCGSTSKVKKAINLKTKETVAIKIVNKSMTHEDAEKITKREVDLLSGLDHPNIIKLHCVIETPYTIYIVMEYVEGIDLNSLILEKAPLPYEENKRLFTQLASALRYCHEKAVIHRDVKTKNIMVDKEGNIKLIDFGLGCFHSTDKFLTTFCGTPAFACPEMVLGKKYKGPEVDVWSTGVVLYAMSTGKLPFGDVTNLLVGKYDLSHPSLSQDLQNLIKGMICMDPIQRITMNEALESDWARSR